MKIYVFGNQDLPGDDSALKIIPHLSQRFPGIQFIIVPPNVDLPFFDDDKIIILDIVQGIKQVELITEDMFNKLRLPPRNTVHDFDLGFQLKYLQKLGKLEKVIIIGIPQNLKINYKRIHSILRKLVAQDIQGS